MTHSALLSAHSCLPWERMRETRKETADVSPAVKSQVLPQPGNGLGRRRQRKEWDCSRLHGHSKAGPRIKTDRGMAGNQSREQGIAWYKTGCSTVSVFHGESGCEVWSQICRTIPGGVLAPVPSSLGLQKGMAHSGFPVTILLYSFTYQEHYKHHFPINTQSLQGNCKHKA